MNTKNKIISFLRPGIIQFSIVLLLILIIVVSNYTSVLNPLSISQSFQNLYLEYGLIIILIAAFLEGLFMLNIYIPASFVIVLSAFALGFDFSTLLIINILSIAGFSIANILNYYLGYAGYYKLLLNLFGNDFVIKEQDSFKKNQFKTIFFSSFHPNFLAISMVSAGISRVNLLKVIFQSIVSLFFWISLWMTLFYVFFKDVEITEVANEESSIIFLAIIFLWGIIKCLTAFYKKNEF